MDESLRIPYTASPLPTPARHGVLILAPHPDDEVFGCGGSAALYRAHGVPVQALILTDGGRWGVPQGSLDIVSTRKNEAIRAAEVLGCNAPKFGGLADRGLRQSSALVEMIIHHVRELRADVLMAPSLWEIHPDHRATAEAAVEAIQILGSGYQLVQYEVGAPLLPNVLVDITPVWQQKKQAMACFVSQLAMQAYDRHIEALNVYRSYTLPGTVHAVEGMRVATPFEACSDPYGLVFSKRPHPVAQWLENAKARDVVGGTPNQPPG